MLFGAGRCIVPLCRIGANANCGLLSQGVIVGIAYCPRRRLDRKTLGWLDDPIHPAPSIFFCRNHL